VDLTPVYTQVAKLTPPSIRFKAWDWLATFEFGREKFTAARLASQEAWKHVAPGDLMAFGVTTTRTFWSMRQELSKRDIAFMLSMGVGAESKLDQQVPLDWRVQRAMATDLDRPQSNSRLRILHASVASAFWADRPRAWSLPPSIVLYR
jgi:hypothetical protein